jgi:restriction system protein
MVEQINLEAWLEQLEEGQPDTISFSFPTDKIRDDYIASIDQWTTDEIVDLLRHFLISSGSLGADEGLLQHFRRNGGSEQSEFARRLFIYEGAKPEGFEGVAPPWEGITWVLDLLPDNPRAAISVIDAYVNAHMFIMPDGRIAGSFDAMEVIRAKYIHRPRSDVEAIRLLLSESPRTLEHLVERLYSAMGYSTTLTPSQKDGGYDVMAVKEEVGNRAKIHIECKAWSDNVGEPIMRGLLGVLSDSKATNGICVTTADLTEPAKEFVRRNPRLAYVAGPDLVRLFNEYLGPNWFFKVDRLVAESRSATKSPV